MGRIVALSAAWLLLSMILSGAQQPHNHPWLEQQDSTTRELLETYGASEEFLAMHDRMLENERVVEEAQKRERRTKTIFIIISAIAALYPAAKSLSLVGGGKKKGKGSAGILFFSLMILLGCAVLFAVNYGWLMLNHKFGESLYFPISFLFVATVVLCCIVALRKK